MKSFYFTKGNIDARYYLSDHGDRTYFETKDPKELIGKIEEIIDFKRKSTLFINCEFDSELIEGLEKLLKDSKVKVDLFEED